MPEPATYTVFLSYSASSAPDRPAQERALASILKLLEQVGTAARQAEPRDWAAVLGFGSVSQKVERLLWEADALIADITGANPNVMFEVGFARARGLPVVFVALEGENGLTPANTGDAELTEYPRRDSSPAEWNDFFSAMKNRLDALHEQQTLGATHLRREAGVFARKISGVTVENGGASTEPMLRILSGWMNQITAELGGHLPSSFQVDADYYQACFSRFTEEERRGALAVADLSRGNERFWVSGELTTDMKVGTRAFLLPGIDFFDTKRIGRVFARLSTEARKYRVLIGRCDTPGFPEHVFDASARRSIGKDILIIGSALVAGYVRGEGHDQLRVVVDESSNAAARKYFDWIREHTIEFETAWTDPEGMRARWIKKFGIGKWSSSWTSVGRDDQYYRDYDLHIRCWVPDYQDLVRKTARVVVDEFDARRARGQSVALLEVGVGTGALTRQVARMLAPLVGPRSGGQSGRRGHSYIGIDKSPEMLDRARRVLSDDAPINVSLECGTAFDDLPAGVGRGSFDVVFGSLVLNHFAGVDVASAESMLQARLEGARSMLRDGGSAVFSDSIIPRSSSAELIRERWSRQMTHRVGLDSSIVSAFFQGNAVMLAMTEEMVERVAGNAGFRSIQFTSVVGEVPSFQIVRLFT